MRHAAKTSHWSPQMNHLSARLFLALGLCLSWSLTLAARPCPVPCYQGDQTVIAAYSLLTQNSEGQTVAIARVILNSHGAACPQLIPRSGPNTPIEMTARINPDPGHFPIQVCEALYPPLQAMQVTASEQRIPAWGGTVGKVVALGDTGCKPNTSGDCPPSWWPFAEIANNAAAEDPDLILHMGDYNYRGTPGSIHIDGHHHKQPVYDAGDHAPNGKCHTKGPYYGQNSPGSKRPDCWSDWWQDFFLPARPLLQRAPWVFARGNHEPIDRSRRIAKNA